MKLLHHAQNKFVCKVAILAARCNGSHRNDTGSQTGSKTSFIAHIDNSDSLCN